MRFIIFTILCLLVVTAIAGVYTYKAADGSIVFTDIPQPNATRIGHEELSTTTTVIPAATQTPPATVVIAETPVIAEVSKPYKSFVMVFPKDQETFQNQPVIPVSVATNPPLQPGDTIQILLDGRAWGPPQAITNFSFTRPDRGTHTVSARLLNKNQQILNSTNPVTIFVHQAHLGTAP